MTVQVQTPRDTFVGDGSEDTFAFGFRLLDNAHLVVEVEGVVQTEITHYTLASLTDLGGDVVFVAAPANNAAILVYRSVTVDQAVDYNPFDAFPAETHERALDKLTMIAQDNTDSIGALIPAGTVGQVLTYNSDGDLVFIDNTGGEGLAQGIAHSDLSSVAGVLSIDYSVEQSVFVTMDENISSTVITGVPTGTLATLEIEFLNDDPVFSWVEPANTTWIEGVPPDFTTVDATLLVRLRSRDGGTSWLGTFGEDFS